MSDKPLSIIEWLQVTYDEIVLAIQYYFANKWLNNTFGEEEYWGERIANLLDDEQHIDEVLKNLHGHALQFNKKGENGFGLYELEIIIQQGRYKVDPKKSVWKV